MTQRQDAPTDEYLHLRLANALQAFADATTALQTAQRDRNAAIARANAAEASVTGFSAECETLRIERDKARTDIAAQPFTRHQVLAANLRIAQLERQLETAERRLATRAVPVPAHRKAA